MADLRETSQVPGEPEAIAPEEFSILELEERLELDDRCNSNCKCPPPP